MVVPTQRKDRPASKTSHASRALRRAKQRVNQLIKTDSDLTQTIPLILNDLHEEIRQGRVSKKSKP
ncbi:MAG: hypothetical protein AAF442_08085 [Pseudomonadota bacterium]